MKTWGEKLADLTELVDMGSDDLTAWEGEFVESLGNQYTEGDDDWEPSPKQDAALTDIYNRVILGIGQ